MVKEVLQVTGREVEVTKTKVAVTKQPSVTRGKRVRVESRVFTPHPEAMTSTSGAFPREDFEDASDKVGRPTGMGKLAHLRPNSEEFAKRKQEEIDLEERRR